MEKIRKSFEVTKTLKEDFIKLCDKNDVKPTNVLSLELEKILQDESLEFNLIEKEVASIDIYLDKELNEKLKAYCARNDIRANSLIRDIIKKNLNKNNKKDTI